MKFTFYLTNGWTSYRFSHNSTNFNIISSTNQTTAYGTLALGQIYANFSTFIPIDFSTMTVMESNSVCSANNTLTLTVTIPTYIPTNSSLYVMVPRSTYNVLTSQYEVYTAMDTINWDFQIPFNCSIISTTLCQPPNSTNTFTIQTTNYMYVPTNLSTITVYILYDSQNLSPNFSTIMSPHIPTAIPSVNMSRLNSNVNQQTQIGLDFTTPMQSSNGLYIEIIPSNLGLNPLLQSCTFVNYSLNSYSSPANATLTFT